MMNIGVVLFSGLLLVLKANADIDCKSSPVNYNNDWSLMNDNCRELIIKQVNMELTAALSYLKMGAFFSRDDINKRGFAKFFFDAASEEREHAIKFIDYLNMRGALPKDLKKLVKKSVADDVKLENAMTRVENGKLKIVTHENGTLEKYLVSDGKSALQKALFLELKVTKSIKSMIEKCETSEDKNIPNDYHFVDYAITEFLDEQLKGQRELAGKISTLLRMSEHYAFSEFLFDKKLLKGEPLL